MKEYKRYILEFEDKIFEIRVLYQDKLINIVAFYNNHPANGFRYQIIIPKHLDVKEVLTGESFTHLLDMTKADIIEKRWKNITETYG